MTGQRDAGMELEAFLDCILSLIHTLSKYYWRKLIYKKKKIFPIKYILCKNHQNSQNATQEKTSLCVEI